MEMGDLTRKLLVAKVFEGISFPLSDAHCHLKKIGLSQAAAERGGDRWL